MIKAVFFDIDGTLYSHKSQSIPDSTLKVLEILREKGIKTFVATGRHFEEIDEFPVGKLSFDGYVMLNGQICTDEKRQIVQGNPIEGKAAEYLLNAFFKHEMPVLILEKDGMYINYVNQEVIDGQAAISTAIPEIGEYTGNPIYQMVCYGGKAVEEKLIANLPNCQITRWCAYGVDVIAKNGGKVNGIKRMLELHNIGRDEMIAFGDGENDKEMLEFSGIGVAMGNAVPKVKEIADYVTDDIDADGIWNALKYFSII